MMDKVRGEIAHIGGILNRGRTIEAIARKRVAEVQEDIRMWNKEHLPELPEEIVYTDPFGCLDPDEEVERVAAWERETERAKDPNEASRALEEIEMLLSK